MVAGAGGWLLSQAVAIRERAKAGRMVGGTGPHWDESESAKRLAEVVERMRMPEIDRQALMKAALPSQAASS